MRYDARFCVAVRGPLEQVRKLPELPQEWFASLNESDQTECVKSDVKMLERSLADLKKLSEKDADQDGLFVGEWEDFTNIGLMYLQFLNFINSHPDCQNVEVAATAQVNYSITDTVGYHSFWGCGEDDALYPEFDEPCDFRLCIPMSVMSRSGEKLTFDLLELENANDIGIGSWGPSEMSSSDATVAFEGIVYLFLQRRKDGTWKALLGGDDLECGLGGSKKLESQILGMPEINGISMDRLLDAGVYSGDLPECSEETIRELLALLLPGKTLSVEMQNGKPFIWDEDGNEYFLGSVIDVNIDDIDSEVDWYLSSDCEWIPKSLFRNC